MVVNNRTSFGLGRIVALAIVVIVLIAVGVTVYYVQSQQKAISLSNFAIESLQIVVRNGNQTISGFVYVAENASQLAQGFQGITSFGDCNGHATNASKCIGMMFVFPSSQELCLWMHNTIIPLQQVWISGNGTVIATYQAQPESDSAVCHNATYVLETSPNMQISIGDGIYQNKA